MSEEIKHNRRRFFGTAAMTLAAAQLGMFRSVDAEKTVIVTGPSQGIGPGVVQALLARGYNVVGTSRSATKSKELSVSYHLALIDGDIGHFDTAQKVAELAIKKFGSIDAVVANGVSAFQQ
jgi:NAD(P)-dependent dehydrogenase (short-subunit alcohol dehydrogenase family)